MRTFFSYIISSNILQRLNHVIRKHLMEASGDWKLLDEIEAVIFQDVGKRGIKNMLVKDDLHKACVTLQKDATSVGILLGFPIFESDEPMEENDGVAGAIYLAKALLHQDKQVTFIIDRHSKILRKTLEDCELKGFLKGSIVVENLPADFDVKNLDVLIDPSTDEKRFTHLVSIERPCRNHSNQYMTMTARDISKLCDPLDLLFKQAEDFPDITTIGIGDGGNEVGMSKVYDKIVKDIPHGKEIAASISCDFLITCGVSNWGGLGLAASMAVLHKSENGSEHLAGFLMSDSQDEALHLHLDRLGFKDGTLNKVGMTVDGLDYYDVHRPILQRLRAIVSKKQGIRI